MTDAKEKRASADADRRLEAASSGSATTNSGHGIHPGFYIALWIVLSSSVIVFNKWVLSSAHFPFPLFLVTYHMLFAGVMTQILARTTSMLDGRHKVPMTVQLYIRAIVPIGLLFSLSLICGNLAYLYLSVSFIQMLKASNAVATLLATWAFGLVPPSLKTLANVALIVIGVAIASFGEIKFDFTGFLLQAGGIVFEAVRLVMMELLLNSPEFKMDPLVSLYYYAPACAVINGVFTAFLELPRLSLNDVQSLGYGVLLANGAIAFLLNVSAVLLIGKTSAVVLTLSGVLKDVLLVAASIIIFGDPVTGLQFVGYSVALAGLVYYKLGGEKMKAAVADVLKALRGTGSSV